MIKTYPKCPACGSSNVSVHGQTVAEQFFKDDAYSHTEHDDREFYVGEFECRDCGLKEVVDCSWTDVRERWAYEEYWGYWG